MNTMETAENMNNLSERALLASLEICSWSGRCIDKVVSEEVVTQKDASKDWGRFSKRLVNKDHLKSISSINNEARKIFKELTLAWEKNARLLPSKLFKELSEKLGNLQDDHRKHVDDFLENYEDYINESRNELGDMFCEDDYPAKSELAEKFAFTFSFNPLSDPNDFRCAIDNSIKTRLQEEMKIRTEQKYNEAIRKLWDKLIELVSKFHEKMSDKDAKFNRSIVENMEDLVELLPNLNVMNDPDLTALSERVRTELCSFDPVALRSIESARESAAKKSGEILEAIGNIYG